MIYSLLSIFSPCIFFLLPFLLQHPSAGLKPKTRDHYHSHRLSYWNNLIPKLHVPGSLFSPTTPSGIEHHLLTDHHDRDSYEGVTRDSTSSRLRALLDAPLNSESSFFQGSSSSSSNALKNITKDASSIKSSTKSPSLSTTSVKLSSSSSSSDHLTKSLSASNLDSSQSHHNHQQQDASSSSSSFPSPPKSILNASSLIIQENSLAVLLLGLGTFLLVINAGLFFRSHYNKNGRNRASNNSNSGGNISGSNMSHGNMTSGILQVTISLTSRFSTSSPLTLHVSSLQLLVPTFDGVYVDKILGCLFWCLSLYLTFFLYYFIPLDVKSM